MKSNVKTKLLLCAMLAALFAGAPIVTAKDAQAISGVGSVGSHFCAAIIDEAKNGAEDTGGFWDALMFCTGAEDIGPAA